MTSTTIQRVCVCEIPQLGSETLRMTFLRPISTQLLDVTTQGLFFPLGNSVLGSLLGTTKISDAL